MTINVLHLRDTHEIGGPGKTILETISHIDNKKYNLHIAVFMARCEKEETPFMKEARKRGFNIHIIRSLNQFDPRILLSIFRLIKKHKIDIIHTHEILTDILGYLISKFCNVRLITTLHGWINNKFKDKVYIYIDNAILKAFNRIIVVSNAMKEQLIHCGISSGNIDVLHNSIVVKNYKKVSKGYLGEIVHKKIKRPVIGTIGRLSLEKGHKDFIKAASVVLQKGYDAAFFLIGDGPEKENLLRLIKNLNLEGKIFITGYLRNIQSVYSDIDLMVLPSYTEGLPNVVLEALLMEVPVIATNVGGTPEIIRNDETGFLIRPGFPEEISSKIIEYLRDPVKFEEMSKIGRLLIEKEFNFNKRTKKLEMIYEDVMDGKKV